MAAELLKMRQVSCTVCKCPDCLFTNPICSGQLDKLLHRRSYRKRETIFGQGAVISGCYVLCQGKVELARYTNEGHKRIVKFLSRGDLFGKAGFWEAKASDIEAGALTKVVIGWLNPVAFQELLKRHSSIMLEVCKSLAQEVEELRKRLTERSYRGTRERLAGLLLELGEKYGCSSDSGLRIDLELTECDLAEMLGNSREWICKQLVVMQRRGWITHRRSKILILDEVGLRQLITPP